MIQTATDAFVGSEGFQLKHSLAWPIKVRLLAANQSLSLKRHVENLIKLVLHLVLYLVVWRINREMNNVLLFIKKLSKASKVGNHFSSKIFNIFQLICQRLNRCWSISKQRIVLLPEKSLLVTWLFWHSIWHHNISKLKKISKIWCRQQRQVFKLVLLVLAKIWLDGSATIWKPIQADCYELNEE